jgi:deoxyribodipyrimidine photo-lyase
MVANSPTAGVIYWFRNDLRLHDQPALHKAIQLATQHQTWLLPIYIHDEALDQNTQWGFVRTSAVRKTWTAMALRDVSRQLQACQSELIQLTGNPVAVLSALSQKLNPMRVICEDIAAPYELEHIAQLQAARIPIETIWQSTLMAASDLPFDVDKVPDTFTNFRHAVEKPGLKVQAPLVSVAQLKSLPPLPPLQAFKTLLASISVLPDLSASSADLSDPRAAFPWGLPEFDGGETCALAHLARYCNSGLPSTYKQTRNELVGVDYSTKWSPWLATGALSARQAWATLKAYEQLHGENESTYWIGFELLWRDHFRWLHLKHGAKMYHAQGLSKEVLPPPPHRPQQFEAWCTANTGHEFIDAGLRELKFTGYVSNRMRQNLASYLIHDLGCDWRAGAAWFESQLIDYDVYSNQGNWLYLSGRGTDPRGSRRFNPDKQAKDYDPNGGYRALWQH